MQEDLRLVRAAAALGTTFAAALNLNLTLAATALAVAAAQPAVR